MDIIPWELWNITTIFQSKGEFTFFYFEYLKTEVFTVVIRFPSSRHSFIVNLDLNVQLYKNDNCSIYLLDLNLL